jgi:hypothetical protein
MVSSASDSVMDTPQNPVLLAEGQMR